jgi:hypothetical protein
MTNNNSKKMGKLQKKMLEFLKKYPNTWHGYNDDFETRRIIKSMLERGLIETNEFNQFKLAE